MKNTKSKKEKLYPTNKIIYIEISQKIKKIYNSKKVSTNFLKLYLHFRMTQYSVSCTFFKEKFFVHAFLCFKLKFLSNQEVPFCIIKWNLFYIKTILKEIS